MDIKVTAKADGCKERTVKGLTDGIVIAGTTEGRAVVEALNRRGLRLAVTVATALGREILGNVTGIETTKVCEGRRDAGGFQALFEQLSPRFVVDASHPFAVEVSRTVKEVCEAMGIAYIRYVRTDGGEGAEHVCEYLCEGEILAEGMGSAAAAVKEFSAGFRKILVNDAVSAAGVLKKIPGNILLTTGANTVSTYVSEIPDFNRRCYIRVLDTEPSVRACIDAGVEKSHVIAAYPPFSCVDNLTLLRQYNIKALVSKDSGDAGGLPEKLESAALMDIPVILIRRPKQDNGVGSIQELETLMMKRGWMGET